jgi:hypothetical protein
VNNTSRRTFIRPISTIIAATRIFLCLILAATTASTVHAQGEIASGTVSGSGSGPYTYNLSLSNAPTATSPIGSVWYAWTPGNFFLPSVPTSAMAPAGWSANIFGNSIQFISNAASNDIAAGHGLPGFSYQAAFTPAQLAAALDSGLSVAYSGGLFSDSGDTFTFQTESVPEPSPLALLITGAIGLYLVGRRKLRAG